MINRFIEIYYQYSKKKVNLVSSFPNIEIIRNKLKTISLLHPFSANAIGLKETDLYCNHSKPHENSLSHLSKLGYDITICYFTSRFFSYTKNIQNIKKRFWPITMPLFNNRHVWRQQGSMWHYLNTIFSPPDLTIINFSGHGSSYVFQLANLLFKKRKPYVAMIGGVNMSTEGRALNYYQQAHSIVVHTELQKKKLQEYKGFKNLNIQVIPLGVDITIFKPPKAKSKKTHLLYVGRISRLKQIELAIETAYFLRISKGLDIQFDIIGPRSDEAYYKELNGMVFKMGLNDSISFLGSMNQNDLIPYYQDASLLLLPSKHESFGMVMVEAMACGTPVVALQNAGGPDEIVKDGFNGCLTTPANYKLNVYNILTTNLLSKYQINSRKSVEEKWSLEYTTKCFTSLAESVFLRDSKNF